MQGLFRAGLSDVRNGAAETSCRKEAIDPINGFLRNVGLVGSSILRERFERDSI